MFMHFGRSKFALILNNFSLIMFVGVCLLTFVGNSSAQDIIIIDDNDVEETVVREGNVLDTIISVPDGNKLYNIRLYLWEMMDLNSIPYGLEVRSGGNEFVEEFWFDQNAKTLREHLDSFALQGAYRWTENDGVINVYSDEKYAFLDVVIEDFTADNLSPLVFRDNILAQKEIKDFLNRSNLLEGRKHDDRGYILSGFIGKAPPGEISATNKTVREILNEFVRKKGVGSWNYGEYYGPHKGNSTRMFYLNR